MAWLVTGCGPDAPGSPTEPRPDPTLENLAVQSISTFITVGDYRIYSVRVRVIETSAVPSTISSISLQFLGGGVPPTRTFENIAKNAIAPRASVELDDLQVVDDRHELDSATTILATVTYAASGRTGTVVAGTAIPNCANYFDVWGPYLIAVAEVVQMSAGL